MSAERKRFEDLLDDFSDAMLTTIGGDGRPYARPMRVARITDGSDLWFVTSKDSDKIEELRTNPVVGVTMQGGGKYLSVTGNAELTDDQATIDEMWSDAWKIWFPKGKDDSSIVLVKVDAEDGAYWDISGTNRLRYLYHAGKAYFTGEEINSEELNMDGKVNLR